MLNDPNFTACLTKLVSVCNRTQTMPVSAINLSHKYFALYFFLLYILIYTIIIQNFLK